MMPEINQSFSEHLFCQSSRHPYAYFDLNNSIIWDHTAVLRDGWLCLPSQSNQYMFWVPHESRLGLCWPGTLAVVGTPLVKLDFGKFRHGSEWEQCRTSAY
jgi:hypothetical protein